VAQHETGEIKSHHKHRSTQCHVDFKVTTSDGDGLQALTKVRVWIGMFVIMQGYDFFNVAISIQSAKCALIIHEIKLMCMHELLTDLQLWIAVFDTLKEMPKTSLSPPTRVWLPEELSGGSRWIRWPSVSLYVC